MARKTQRDGLALGFQAAEYCVRLGAEDLVTFKIGEFDAQADTKLTEAASIESQWAILTPYNPGARRLSDAENRDRLTHMEKDIDRAGLRCLPSVNLDPEGQWPDEQGFCIVDATEGYSIELGRTYGQAAIVTGKPGEAPRLVWLTGPSPA